MLNVLFSRDELRFSFYAILFLKMRSDDKKIQRVTAKAIIIDEGRVLMLCDQKGLWELPGGKVEFGEHPIDALKRELIEELTIKDVRVGKLFDVKDFVVELPLAHYQFIVLIFLCDIDPSNIKSSNEHSRYRWMSMADIISEPMRDCYRETIMTHFKESR